MNTIKRLLALTVLTASLTLNVLAGETHNPGVCVPTPQVPCQPTQDPNGAVSSEPEDDSILDTLAELISGLFS